MYVWFAASLSYFFLAQIRRRNSTNTSLSASFPGRSQDFNFFKGWWSVNRQFVESIKLVAGKVWKSTGWTHLPKKTLRFLESLWWSVMRYAERLIEHQPSEIWLSWHFRLPGCTSYWIYHPRVPEVFRSMDSVWFVNPFRWVYKNVRKTICHYV